jgi:3D (Asp-Asp-Asp) domain-containing protein
MPTYSVMPLTQCRPPLVLLAFMVLLFGSFRTLAQQAQGEQAQGAARQTDTTSQPEKSKSERQVPAEVYTATAYTLRGRTASGRPVARGVIAADPRILPLGTRVRIDAGEYSGEYLVADTGGAVRGRRIDIWTPNLREVAQFGTRRVRISIRSVAPPYLEDDLQKRYVENRITRDEYEAERTNLAAYAMKFYREAANENLENPQMADYNPLNFPPAPSEEGTLVQTYFGRMRLEMDYGRKVIGESEYNQKLSQLTLKERDIIRKRNISSTEVADYYDAAAQIAPNVALLAQSRAHPLISDESLKWIGLLLGLLGVLVTVRQGYKKRKRENLSLQLERTRVRQLTKRIADLEQSVPKEKLLIIP